MNLILEIFGKQKYIFNDIESKKTVKRIRGRSALIQIFTKLFELELKKLFPSAKIEIFISGKLKINIDEKETNYKEKINSFQKTLDLFFLEKFNGELGSYLFLENDNKQKFKNQQIIEKVNDVCSICKKRKNKKESCSVCETEMLIGEKLAKKYKYLIFSKNIEEKDAIDIFFNNYKICFRNEKIKEDKENIIDLLDSNFYINYKNEENNFDSLSDNTNSITIIKGDVDSLGNFFLNKNKTSNEKNDLSLNLNNFFGKILEESLEKYNVAYIFTGGDDIFLATSKKDSFNVLKTIKQKFNEKFGKYNITLSLATETIHYKTPPLIFYNLIEKSLENCKTINNGIKNHVKYLGEYFILEEFNKNKMLNTFYKEALELIKQKQVSINEIRQLYFLLKKEKKLKNKRINEIDFINCKKISFFRKSKLNKISCLEKEIDNKFLLIKVHELLINKEEK